MQNICLSRLVNYKVLKVNLQEIPLKISLYKGTLLRPNQTALSYLPTITRHAIRKMDFLTRR